MESLAGAIQAEVVNGIASVWVLLPKRNVIDTYNEVGWPVDSGWVSTVLENALAKLEAVICDTRLAAALMRTDALGDTTRAQIAKVHRRFMEILNANRGGKAMGRSGVDSKRTRNKRLVQVEKRLKEIGNAILVFGGVLDLNDRERVTI